MHISITSFSRYDWKAVTFFTYCTRMCSLRIWFHRKWTTSTIRQKLLIFAIAVIVFNEYLVYTFQTFRWSSLPEINAEEDMVLLLVSDPQIVGIQDEMGFPVGMFSRWDCDRYLRKTFSRAFSYSKPDVIIFLGDIMDEGSKATPEEYESYVQRFRSIYYETQYTKTIILPGDNDIGGEGGDFRTPFKIDRFEKHFENLTGVVSHKFTDFFKFDIRMNYDALPEKQLLISSAVHSLKNPVRIIINHESIMPKFKSTIYPLLRLAQPSLMISGHWHLSQMFTCDTCLSDNNDLYTWPYKLRRLDEDVFFDLDLTKPQALNELMVPTCSYRMGVPNMGFGVAVLNKRGSMKYSVIWLPSRYTVLTAYLVALGFVLVILLLDYILSPLKNSTSLFT